MISKIPFALLSLLGNVFFVLFPFVHPLQTPSCFACISGRPWQHLFLQVVVPYSAHVQAFYAKVHLALLSDGPKLVLDGPLICISLPPITTTSSMVFPFGHIKAWLSTNATLIPFASNANMERIFF